MVSGCKVEKKINVNVDNRRTSSSYGFLGPAIEK